MEITSRELAFNWEIYIGWFCHEENFSWKLILESTSHINLVGIDFQYLAKPCENRLQNGIYKKL